MGDSGVGGYDFAVEKYEILRRTAVHAHDAIVREGHEDAGLPQGDKPRRLPRTSPPHRTCCIGISTRLTTSHVFDPVRRTSGRMRCSTAWQSHGPQIDAGEMMALENRMSVLTDYVLPITEGSERILCALMPRMSQDDGRLAVLQNDKVVRHGGQFVVYNPLRKSEWRSYPRGASKPSAVDVEL